MIWWLLQNCPGFAALYYRFRCPYPIIANKSARACVEAGCCGCNNAEWYRRMARKPRAIP